MDIYQLFSLVTVFISKLFEKQLLFYFSLLLTIGKSIPCLFQAFVDKHNSHGISKTFEVYYKHEDILIKDRFVFKLDMLVDGSKVSRMQEQVV